MFHYLPWNDESLTKGEDVEALIADMRLSILLLMIFFFAISMLITYLIPHQPGQAPKDPIYRRMVFWFLGIGLPALLVALYIYGARGLISDQVADLVPGYYESTFMTLGLSIVGSALLGAALSKTVLKRSKYGDIFGKQHNR